MQRSMNGLVVEAVLLTLQFGFLLSVDAGDHKYSYECKELKLELTLSALLSSLCQ